MNKGENMSLVAPVNLLSQMTRDDCNIFTIKKFDVSNVKQEEILRKLAFMSTFNELSQWVEINTKGQRYIACPTRTTYEDRHSCLNNIQQLLFQSLKGENKRKDGRDLKLLVASNKGDYYTIASILASTAWSYWQTYLLNNGNAVFYAKNQKINQQKIELQKAQIEHIGAAVSFKKARKKGAIQEIFDFFESEEILKINDFEN